MWFAESVPTLVDVFNFPDINECDQNSPECNRRQRQLHQHTRFIWLQLFQRLSGKWHSVSRWKNYDIHTLNIELQLTDNWRVKNHWLVKSSHVERSFVGLYLFTLFIINHPFTVRVEFDREIPMFITALTVDSQPCWESDVTGQNRWPGSCRFCCNGGRQRTYLEPRKLVYVT